MYRLTLIKMCSFFGEIAQNSSGGIVHSVFDNALNLLVNNQLLTILNKGNSLSPFSAELGSNLAFRGVFNVGDKVRTEQDCLIIGKRIISIASTEVINLKVNLENIKACQPTTSSYYKLLEKAIATAPLAGEGIAPVLTSAFSDSGISFGGNIWSNFLLPKITQLKVLLNEGRFASLKVNLPQIAGCGPGLTPSSDDFIVGLMGAFYHCIYFGKLDKTSTPQILKEACQLAGEKTGEISSFFITRAGEGIFSENLLKLITTSSAGVKNDKISKVMESITGYGSTSGADTLAGYYFGIRSIAGTV